MAKKKTPAQPPIYDPKKPKKTDYDNPWKSVIELYFRDFLRFFFPAIEADIDWSKPIVFLDKELQKVVRDGEIPKRYADKLVQVYRLNGEQAVVICHIEVQGQHEENFEVRMYSYNYRLRDRYNCPVVSLAILADESDTWRPQRYEDELWGCSTHFEFPIAKLTDYEADWAALEASRNPFAVVVMAHLKTKETHKQPELRKSWRYYLTTMLYDQDYSEQDILALDNFLDWLMNLPEELEKQFQIELKAFEEARQMKYVTTIERMAEERGQISGERSLVLKQLTHKLGSVSDQAIEHINALSIEQLDLLGAALLDFGSIDDLTSWLDNQG